MAGRKLPLEGVKVIELCHVVMGPTCGMILGDLGADVIKVEPAPDGDNTRRLVGSGIGFFATFNRNKRSIALDLKSPEGRDIVRRLIADADVLTENFRPGALDAMGLGHDDCRKLNPRLIYCSLKGFLSGPYQDRAALDEVVQMMAGLAYMTGPRGRPLRAGSSVNDIMGGMFAAIAILAALRERDGTGAGQKVVSALFENCSLLSAQHMMQFAVSGKPAPPMPDRLAAWGIYDVFDCADGQLFIGVVTDTQWKVFCETFGLGDLYADPGLATNTKRCGRRDELMPRLRALFSSWPLARLEAAVAKAGLPYAPIVRPEQLFDDPHLKASGGLLPIRLPAGRETVTPALPVELDGRRLGVRRGLPAVGEHGREVLREIGLGEDEIAALEHRGVVGRARP